MYRRIAVDIDEVLCSFFHPMAKHNKHKIPRTPHQYIFSQALGISEKESKKMVSDFYKTETFKKLKPLKDSQETLKLLSDKSELYIVTGRQDEVKDETERWIRENFPGIFKDVILTNSFTPVEVSKADICLSLGIELLIDDSLENCLSCEKNGIKTMNFIGEPQYPWCIKSNLSVNTWKEISNEIL